jgi:CHAT domain-containing protein
MSDETLRLQEVQARAKQLLDGGEPDRARIALDEGLPLAEAQQNHAAVVSMLGMLAACLTRLMRFDEAEAAYERATLIAEEKLEAAHPIRVIVTSSRAVFERGRGALDQEKRAWERVLPVLQREPRFASLLVDCQLNLQDIETLAPEEDQLRQSFEAARRLDMSVDPTFDERKASFAAAQQAATALTTLYGKMGRLREQASAMRDGLMMRPDELWRTLTGVTAPYRRRVLDEQRCRFNLFLRRVLRNQRPEAAQTALEALVWRRGIGLELYQSANRVARQDAEARTLLDTIRFNRASYAAMVYAAPSDTDMRSTQHMQVVLEPIEQNPEYQALERQLFARLEPSVNRFVSQPVDCAELASKLPDDGLLIEFWRCTWPGDQGALAFYLALVLPAHRPDRAAVVQLCDAAVLESTLIDYVSLLSGRSRNADLGHVDEVKRDPARARQLGDTIRQLILDPLQPWVDRASHLLLVTDGLLSRLPFSALPVGDGYLLDRWLVSYLHSARDLFASNGEPVAATPALVIADPSYAWPGSVTRGDVRFDRLECAAEEAATIARMLGVTPLTHTDATRHALMTSRSPEILHVATHGMMLPAKPSIAEFAPVSPLIWRDAGELRLHIPGLSVFADGIGRLSRRQVPDQSLRSIIALAGVNTWLDGDPLPTEAGNGLVTAEDIASMDLAGNKLAVLSACETGLGVIGVGEGVLGLGSSLAIAGAETVVTTLWSVDDTATRDLMVACYEGVLNGKGRAEALQEAQRKIRQQFPDDPYYWSPFICHGAFGPMRDARHDAG